MTECGPPDKKFQPFDISTWRRYTIDSTSDLHQQLVKSLELPADNEYEIIVQVRGIKKPLPFP